MSLQSAAIPYRVGANGQLEVMLVTSRGTRRWIIPKGKVGPGLLPSRSAEREAFEEAGVLGTIDKQPVGTYWQGETMPGLSSGGMPVQAFGLAVVDELPVWKEMHQRERRWFGIKDAMRTVRDPQIRALLKTFGQIHK